MSTFKVRQVFEEVTQQLDSNKEQKTEEEKKVQTPMSQQQAVSAAMSSKPMGIAMRPSNFENGFKSDNY